MSPYKDKKKIIFTRYEEKQSFWLISFMPFIDRLREMVLSLQRIYP
jgi:hypothetical protein